MRIKNKYLRNKHFRTKHWKTIRNREHPFRTYCPPKWLNPSAYDVEEQIRDHFEWINKQARHLESGTPHSGYYHASSSFRRQRNCELRAKQKSTLNKVRLGDYNAEFPLFKRDVDWDWT